MLETVGAKVIRRDEPYSIVERAADGKQFRMPNRLADLLADGSVHGLEADDQRRRALERFQLVELPDADVRPVTRSWRRDGGLIYSPLLRLPGFITPQLAVVRLLGKPLVQGTLAGLGLAGVLLQFVLPNGLQPAAAN